MERIRQRNMLASGPVPCAVNVVVGHYGTGKTNFCLNWALDLARAGRKITLVDFDVVNPYFRSSDYTAQLADAGVTVIAPNLAGSSLDNPSISGAVATVISQTYACWQQGDDSSAVIIDVGGDDAGATVLGRFSVEIAHGAYAMLYVINKYRNLTREVHEAIKIMSEIQAKSGLRVTGVVNNSHLRDQTDIRTISDAFGYGVAFAKTAQLDLVCTTVPKSATEQMNHDFCQGHADAAFYPVRMLVRTPWE